MTSEKPTLRIVVFSDHVWNSTPFGMHHIARALVNLGHKVLFVEPPYSPLHLLNGRRRGRKPGLHRATDADGLQILSPFALIPHLNIFGLRSKATMEHWQSFTCPNLVRSIRQANFDQPDIAFNCSPIFFKTARHLSPKKLVLRLADDRSMFDVISLQLLKCEKEQMSVYDSVFASSSKLQEMARRNGAKHVSSLTNGAVREITGIPSLNLKLNLCPIPECFIWVQLKSGLIGKKFNCLLTNTQIGQSLLWGEKAHHL